MTDPERWDDSLDELRAAYLSVAAERLSRAESELDLLVLDPGDAGALARLRKEFHGFTGSGSSYGFPEVTRLGSEGERACLSAASAGLPVAREEFEAWRGLFSSIRAELSGIPAPSAGGGSRPQERGAAPLRVLLATADPPLARTLEPLFTQEGIEVETLSSGESLLSRLSGPLPDAFVLDVSLGAVSLVQAVRACPGGDLPAVVVLGGGSEFGEMVEALRGGVDVWLEKPVDGPSLLRSLRLLLQPDAADAPRILSVEDDPDQAAFVRLVLESAGYDVRTCSDPARFGTDLARFRPDLVLLDVGLPGVSGYDLARFVRQGEGTANLPVVFLTADPAVAARIRSAQSGGDEHLVKPVPPGLLLSTVSARLERGRFLSSLVDRDGLTMLLTQAAFLERAAQAVSRERRRTGLHFQWVSIDIDGFRSVNHRFGYPSGDRVLVSLASLLRQRLRPVDAVGRLGGDDFALLLEETTGEDAVALVDSLRADFASREHAAPGGETFRVTFSAGVAALSPLRATVSAWRQEAEEALRKSRG